MGTGLVAEFEFDAGFNHTGLVKAHVLTAGIVKANTVFSLFDTGNSIRFVFVVAYSFFIDARCTHFRGSLIAVGPKDAQENEFLCQMHDKQTSV